MAKLGYLLATCGYLGNIPFASGTFGSIGGVVFYYFFIAQLGVALQLVFLLVLFFVAWWSINASQEQLQKISSAENGDHKQIVIDEFLGVHIALIGTQSIVVMLLALVLFRIFDIFKPWIIGHIDNNWHGAVGIIADDIVAGIFAWVVTFLATAFIPLDF